MNLCHYSSSVSVPVGLHFLLLLLVVHVPEATTRLFTCNLLSAYRLVPN